MPPVRRRRDRAAARARRALEDIHEGIVGPRPSASIARESDGAVDEDEVVSNPRRIPSDDADADTERVVDLDAARAALTCVITNAVFVDPVTTPCGHTFEREALARWITRGERERLDASRLARGALGTDAPANCPQCRSALYHELPHEWPVNTTVRECVEAVFGKSARDAEARRARAARDAEAENVDGNGGVEMMREYGGRGDAGGSASTRGVPLMRETCALPMFFLDALTPGQEVTLNVFEAKYKILIRRCLMTSRKFLMINAEDADEEEFEKNLRDDDDRLEVPEAIEEGCRAMRVSLREFGRFCVECAIVTCQELVDGRFLVRVRAMHHVFVRSAVRDPSGYCVGTCSRVREGLLSTSDDVAGAADEDEDEEERIDRARAAQCKIMLSIHRALMLFDVWIAMTNGSRWLYNYGGKMSTLLQAVGARPDKLDCSALSWWLVRVMNPIPTIDATIEMRSICLNAWNVDVRFRVIAQMLAYSLVLVQRHGVRAWVKREHVVAVSVCDELYGRLQRQIRGPSRGARRREQTSLARLLVSENVGGVVEEVVRLLESSTLDQETAAKIRAKPSSERWTHEDFETVVEGLIRVGDGESRRAGESSLVWGDVDESSFRGALDYLIATRGPGALALAAWRALSQFDCDDKRLAAWNATLMSHCPNPTDSSPDGPTGVTTNELFQIAGSFGELLRRDMRCGVYRFLYAYDAVRLVVYFLYRLVLVVVFALGFLFELVFDREYHGGSRTAMRGLFVTTCALGAFCGTLARNAWLSYSQGAAAAS